MARSKVSVVIPVYNTADYLHDTLASITGQTLRDIEIIVVNDGSTDSSLSVAETFAASDLRVRIVSQPNKGLSEARNTGLRLVTGDYVYFMDSDDLLDADALELCYEKCVAEKLDFVLFDAETFGEAERLSFDYYRARCLEDRVYRGAELLDRLLDKKKYRASVCLNVMQTDFLKENGLTFFPGILHEDELFTAITYLSASRVGRIDRAFFKRRMRSNSIMTTRFSRRNTDSYLVVAAQLRAYGKSQPPGIRQIVSKLVRYILNPAVYNAWQLPAGQRMELLGEVLEHYPGELKWKNVAVLLFKKPLSKIRPCR